MLPLLLLLRRRRLPSLLRRLLQMLQVRLQLLGPGALLLSLLLPLLLR